MQEILDSQMKKRLNDAFLEENRRFIEKKCLERLPVCPRTEADLQATNVRGLVSPR